MSGVPLNNKLGGMMKGCPEVPDEFRGVSYRRVNELVGSISVGTTREQLVTRLGEPDEIRSGSPNGPGEIQDLMDEIAGGQSIIQWADPQGFEEVLVYRDPYRPRKSHLFGIRGNAVTQKWQESSSA